MNLRRPRRRRDTFESPQVLRRAVSYVFRTSGPALVVAVGRADETVRDFLQDELDRTNRGLFGFSAREASAHMSKLLLNSRTQLPEDAFATRASASLILLEVCSPGSGRFQRRVEKTKEWVSVLLALGASPNATVEGKSSGPKITALHQSAILGRDGLYWDAPQIASLLLAAGASADARDRCNCTPLAWTFNVLDIIAHEAAGSIDRLDLEATAACVLIAYELLRATSKSLRGLPKEDFIDGIKKAVVEQQHDYMSREEITGSRPRFAAITERLLAIVDRHFPDSELMKMLPNFHETIDWMTHDQEVRRFC